VDKCRKALSASKRSILRKDNVVGVGIGNKTVKGVKTEEPSIIVFVTKKVDRKELRARSVIPGTVRNAKTDVVEIGEVKALAATDRIRPAYPGVSVGHYAITAGTLGAVVKSKRNGDILILSNNHVLANVTNGSDGRSKKGDPILQPGPADGGVMDTDTIAYLEDFVPIVKDSEVPTCPLAKGVTRLANIFVKLIRPSYTIKMERANPSGNYVDAAVAKVKDSNQVTSQIPKIGEVKGVGEANIGSNVGKLGRTSGFTSGTIEAVDVSLKVNMSENITAFFEGQIVSDIKSLPGDSGSLVTNEKGEAVGLLFAGSDTRTIINPIQTVLDKLNIEFM